MTELFQNPGFEDWTAGAPDHWTVSTGGACTVTQDTNIFHSGTSSLKMTIDGTPSACSISQSLTLLKNTNHSFAIWRYNSEAGKSVKLTIKDSGNHVYLYYDSANDLWMWDTVARTIAIPNVSEDMAPFYLGFATHPDYTDYVFIIERGEDAASSAIYVDDVSLVANTDEDSEQVNLHTLSEPDEHYQTVLGVTDELISDAESLDEWSVPSHKIDFTSGGTWEVKPGDTIIGATSGATAYVEAVCLTGGTWGAGTAAGRFHLSNPTGTFIAENLNISGHLNVATVAGAASASELSISLDTDSVYGNFSIRCTIASGTTSPVLILKKAPGDQWNLASAKFIRIWAKTNETGRYLVSGFGEVGGAEQLFTQTNYLTSAWKQFFWDVTAIASTSRDAVTRFVFYWLAVTPAVRDLWIDLVAADMGYPKITAALPSGNVQTYPQFHNFQSFEAEFGGDGRDGDTEISGGTTVLSSSGIGVKVLRYTNLTIKTGGFLTSASNDPVLVILVRGVLTFETGGGITMDSRGGSASSNRVGGGEGGFGGGGGGGAASGTQGGGGGGANQPGMDGVATARAQGGGRRIATDGTTSGFNYGGSGLGAGGDGPNNAVGQDGSRNIPDPLSPISFELARRMYGGGGGGGASNTGGGGGAGGGVVWIEANEIVWNGTGYVHCNGANGTAATSNGGGGGGGAGGAVFVFYRKKNGTANLQANGGSGGAKNGTGSNGGNGATGVTSEIQVG